MNGSILQAHNVTMTFGKRTVLDRVSFSLQRGSLCAVIGPNGAGKTTLLNIISGYIVGSAGTVAFRGVTMHRASPEHFCDLGVARTFQIATAFPSLTVTECVAVALARRYRWRLF